MSGINPKFDVKPSRLWLSFAQFRPRHDYKRSATRCGSKSWTCNRSALQLYTDPTCSRINMLRRSLYKALRDGEIRLLTVHSQSNFTLENVYLRDNPRYIAISHRWGDFIDLCNVRVNDIEDQLPRHVNSMLSNLYNKLQMTPVWLDMVCINQKDPELSEQVSRMGEIYSSAEKVYA
jgi:hypothetical protein